MKQIAEGIFLFDNDDAGYHNWIKDNPDGFVVNTYRKPNARYLKTHRARCYTIKNLQPGYTSFTTDYRKYCSNELDKLKEWALMEVQGKLQFCLKCLK